MRKLIAIFCLLSMVSTAFAEESVQVSKVYFKAKIKDAIGVSQYDSPVVGLFYNNVVGGEHLDGWIVAENTDRGHKEIVFPVRIDIRSTGATAFIKLAELGYSIDFHNWDGKRLSDLLGRYNGFKGQVAIFAGVNLFGAVNFRSGVGITNAGLPAGGGLDLSVLEIRILPNPSLDYRPNSIENLDEYNALAEEIILVN